jgi:hypothetical protein
MIPEPLWQQNLRNKLGQTQWRKLRKSILEQRGTACEVCGSRAEGRRYLHEGWSYDTTQTNGSAAIAKLTGLKILCWLCHAVEHFGRTTQIAASGHAELKDVIAHAMSVNGINVEQFERHARRASIAWERLGWLPRWTWRIDFGAYSQMLWEHTADADPNLRQQMTPAEIERLLNGESPIRLWRKKKGLTQAAVAERTAMWYGYRTVERKPVLAKVDDIKRIARALRVPPHYLALDYDVRALWKNSDRWPALPYAPKETVRTN